MSEQMFNIGSQKSHTITSDGRLIFAHPVPTIGGFGAGTPQNFIK
jgi:hypothetical protein